MSYDLELFRRQVGHELTEMSQALRKLLEGEELSSDIANAFLLDKRLIAQELIDSPLAVDSIIDLDDLPEEEDIELRSMEGAEPLLEICCSDYLIGISVPFGPQSGQWLEGLMSLWAVVFNICERNHLVFYDAQLDCEANMESFERTVLHFSSNV